MDIEEIFEDEISKAMRNIIFKIPFPLMEMFILRTIEEIRDKIPTELWNREGKTIQESFDKATKKLIEKHKKILKEVLKKKSSDESGVFYGIMEEEK